jgi:hypothetical protein
MTEGAPGVKQLSVVSRLRGTNPTEWVSTCVGRIKCTVMRKDQDILHVTWQRVIKNRCIL